MACFIVLLPEAQGRRLHPGGGGEGGEVAAEPRRPPDDAPPAEDSAADATAPINTAVDPKTLHEAALAKYEQDFKRYQSDLKSFEEKVKAGEIMTLEQLASIDWFVKGVESAA